MLVLAADTSTSYLTVAVCDENGIRAETNVQCGRAHSERLIETTQWVIEQAGLTLTDIEALAISIGPGSFTGVRVGVATWKGLAFAANKPLVGVPTLDAMTNLLAVSDGLICPMIDARMQEVFTAQYQFRNGIREKCTPEMVCPVEDILNEGEGPLYLLGDGAMVYRDRILSCAREVIFVAPPCDRPRASSVAFEAMNLMESGVETDPMNVVPVYLRQSQAEINRAKRLVAES